MPHSKNNKGIEEKPIEPTPWWITLNSPCCCDVIYAATNGGYCCHRCGGPVRYVDCLGTKIIEDKYKNDKGKNI